MLDGSERGRIRVELAAQPTGHLAYTGLRFENGSSQPTTHHYLSSQAQMKNHHHNSNIRGVGFVSFLMSYRGWIGTPVLDPDKS